MFSRAFLIFSLTFLINNGRSCADTANKDVVDKSEGRFFSLIEDKLEVKLGEYVNIFTKWLEKFNDKHLGASELGRMIHYEDIKPSLQLDTARASRMNKKMSMAMMPLIFHVGATSTWMILTSIMAAKSVAIGLALLVFKIAVSSAKLASFFTLLKGKHTEDHHHGWSWSPPHEHHHAHDRSFTDIEHHSPPQDWHSYNPEWTPNEVQEYHTIPASYKHSEDLPGPYVDEKSDRKKFSR